VDASAPPDLPSVRAEPQPLFVEQETSSLPEGTPKRLWDIVVKLKKYNPYYIPWEKQGWLLPGQNLAKAPDQEASIDVAFHAEMYIAANLKNKVIRLTTLGNGFSVGTMRKNEWRERGVFQDECSLSYGPSAESPLRMGDNQPQNTNNVAKYSCTTGFEVAAKASAKQTEKGGEGGGELTGSYKVSNTVSTELNDFAVTNESTVNEAKWTWRLQQMGDGNASYTYPYDGPSSLITLLRAWVCPLPSLSRGRLFPACQAYWYVDRGFKGVVRFSVKAIQMTSYIVTQDTLSPVTKSRPAYFIEPPTRTMMSADFDISFDESLWDVKPPQ
jgi:hypothetical protein